MYLFARARRLCQTAAALLLVLVLTTDAAAAVWAYPKPLTRSGTVNDVGLATMAPSTAVLVYTENGAGRVRRSTDGGVTWGKPTSVPGTHHWICGFGTSVDLVWLGSSRVRYARSTNSGASFRSPLVLSPSSGEAHLPMVAHGPSNRVVVTWLARTTASWDVKVRVSTNGGASFAAAKTLATNVTGSPGVAVGKGVLYMSYRDGGLFVRRSVNSGATWSAPRLVAGDAYGDPLHRLSMTAAGSQAYIAYVAVEGLGPHPQWVRYVRTANKGATWKAPRDLSPGPNSAAYLPSDNPSVALQNGIVRAVFTRDLDASGFTMGVFYRQSSGGKTWTKAYAVSIPVDTPGATDAMVGFARRAIVGYLGYPETAASDAYVRTRK